MLADSDFKWFYVPYLKIYMLILIKYTNNMIYHYVHPQKHRNLIMDYDVYLKWSLYIQNIEMNTSE